LDLDSIAAAGVLVLHLLFILWVAFGAPFTRRRPLLRWFHIASLMYGRSEDIALRGACSFQNRRATDLLYA